MLPYRKYVLINKQRVHWCIPFLFLYLKSTCALLEKSIQIINVGDWVIFRCYFQISSSNKTITLLALQLASTTCEMQIQHIWIYPHVMAFASYFFNKKKLLKPSWIGDFFVVVLSRTVSVILSSEPEEVSGAFEQSFPETQVSLIILVSSWYLFFSFMFFFEVLDGSACVAATLANVGAARLYFLVLV